jgi:hypothetical protein
LEEVPGVKPNSIASYRLLVEFDVDGNTYTVKSHSSYHVPDYNLGDPVQVIYDPDDPETALNLFVYNFKHNVLGKAAHQ